MNRKILALFCGLVMSFSLFAQESTQELNLSLEQAREYALENNRTLQNASLDVQMAYAARWQTIASMLPSVDASFDYQNMCGYEMNFSGMSIPMNPYGTLGVTAALAVNGQLIVAALISDLAIDMQDINRKNSELDIVSSVESLYITALAMEKTMTILDETLLNLEELYKTTSAAVKVGAAEQTDADQIMVQVASMKSSINSTKRSVEMIYNSLALQLAVGIDSKIVLTDDLDNILNVESTLELLKTEFIVANNYGYMLTEKNVEMAQRNVLLATMAYTPTISAYYAYSYKTYFGKDEGFNMTVPNVVGVSVSVPIFSSGKRWKAVTEKKLARQSAENTLADTEDALRVQDKQLRYNLSSAYEDFDTQKLNIEVSQRVFKSTSNKYEHGYASSLELTNASTTLLSAQSDYIQSLLTLVNAQIDLKKLLNK
ncbi:MAG: TolC family protein [bacterium]